MQKHKFSVSCPDMVFVESVQVPPEHKKQRVDISRPGCTEIQYVTRSHWMQKRTFGITCLDIIFVESVPFPPEHEK
jgi:hypothetical protein